MTKPKAKRANHNEEEKRELVMSEHERNLMQAFVKELFANQIKMLGMTVEQHTNAHRVLGDLQPFMEAQKKEFESRQIFRDQIYSILGMNRPRLRRFLWGALLFLIVGTFVGWKRAAELIAAFFGG